MHLEREVTEDTISRTPTETRFIMQLADVIGSPGKTARAASIVGPNPFPAERVKECECAVSREIPGVRVRLR
jgi:hypothetical protein